MIEVYVICNQIDQYLTKKKQWCSGRDASEVFFGKHYDEALNQLCEMNAKDIDLRGRVVAAELDNKKPVLTVFGPEPEIIDSPAES